MNEIWWYIVVGISLLASVVINGCILYQCIKAIKLQEKYSDEIKELCAKKKDEVNLVKNALLKFVQTVAYSIGDKGSAWDKGQVERFLNSYEKTVEIMGKNDI